VTAAVLCMGIGGSDCCNTFCRQLGRKEVRKRRRRWKDSGAVGHRVAKCGLDLSASGTCESVNELSG
jgi:hypothetical protein